MQTSGFGSKTLGSTSSSAWSAEATLQRSSNNPFEGYTPATSTAIQKVNASTHKRGQHAETEETTLRREADEAQNWAALHGVERFVHPRTGVELPEVVWFYPGRCELLNGGKVSCRLRGLLHYLATGGSEDFVNPAEKSAQISALRTTEEWLRKLVSEEREKALEMESMLLMLQLEDSRTTESMIAMVRAARDHLETAFRLEDQLQAEETLFEPNQSHVDDMRRRVQDMSHLVDTNADEAEKLEVFLRHQEVLRAGLLAKRRRIKEAEVEIRRVQKCIFFLERNGFVQVQSSGWQRARQEDVLSLVPKFSWSHYTWEDEASPDHPHKIPAGAWFSVRLPTGLWIIPSHYALRHGDDGVPAAPAVRHDSNASVWDATRTIAPSDPPVTTWGSTTRAQRDFCGTALLDWQLWAREGGESAPWVLLSEHKGDTALHSPFGEAAWRVDDSKVSVTNLEDGKGAVQKRKFVEFLVIMTGPTSNGGHGLFCSGFDVFGQVGEEKEKRPPPQAPSGFKYKFDNELYICDKKPIIPNECVVSGTNDELCPMTFSSDPPLPNGLVLDAKTGTISGALELESLGDWQMKVLSGAQCTFTVTCANQVGSATTKVTWTMITAPRFFSYRHSDATYEVGDCNMAFSAELLTEAEKQGWKRPPFLPVDLPRETAENTIREECDVGSRFTWPANAPLPTVGGVPVEWEGRLSWPKFELAGALPQGLELDEMTASISGVPTREEKGTFVVRCVNPAGFTTTDVIMSVMMPPRGFEYEKAECVLVYMADIGIKTCRCEEGTHPLRFAAEKLPRGLKIDPGDGSITGIASQLDQNFMSYIVRVANDVGLDETHLKLLCALPMDQIDEADRIVNLNVEARVGQKVRGTPRFIASRSITGLPDPSATFPRHPQDALRFRTLESRSRRLGWKAASRDTQADPREMHVAAAGRGTITQVLLDGNACQVRWENTGLVSVYRTGKDGEYELQLWGTSRRLVEAWEALDERVRSGLSSDDAELERNVDAYLAEYRAGGRWQHRELTKLGLFDPDLHTWLNNLGPLPFGKKDNGLLQRLVMELSNPPDGDGDGDDSDDASFNPAKKFSRELWNCLHIRDARVGLAIDWDPYIGFMECVQHGLAVDSGSRIRPGLKIRNPGRGPVSGEGAVDKAPKKKLRGKSKKQPEEAEWELGASERKCVMAWLLIDKKLRLALQDSVGEGWTADAAVRMVRSETRRMGKQQFLRGAREMSAGLQLALSDNTILLLFKQADGDMDGYITLSDVVRSFRESRRLSRWQKQRRKDVGMTGGAGPACIQAGINVTWSDLVERVHARPVSMTLHAAADIHDIIESKIYPAVAPFERKAKLALSRGVKAWAAEVAGVGAMRQWAQFSEAVGVGAEGGSRGEAEQVGGLGEVEEFEEGELLS